MKEMIDCALRRWSPKRYCLRMLKRTERENRVRLKAAQSLPKLEYRNLRSELNSNLWEWIEWLHSIEDQELVLRAKKMDILLTDFITPEPDQFQDPDYFKIGEFGGKVLYAEMRDAITRAIRERMPLYRKERREIYEFYLKVVLGVGTIITGIGGTLIGILASIRK